MLYSQNLQIQTGVRPVLDLPLHIILIPNNIRKVLYVCEYIILTDNKRMKGKEIRWPVQ